VATLYMYIYYWVSVWADEVGREHRFVCIFEVLMYWFKSYLFFIVVDVINYY
jgi:hypothetical protein